MLKVTLGGDLEGFQVLKRGLSVQLPVGLDAVNPQEVAGYITLHPVDPVVW